MSTSHRTVVAAAMLLGTVLCGANLHAAPFRPASDDEVVERVPVRTGRPLATKVLAQGDEGQLLERARDLIRTARLTGDPRHLGRAEALLRSPPQGDALERLVLQATIDQSLHRFDTALARLDEALRRDPWNAQARLTRATVLQVRGRFDAAARDCAMLGRVATPLVTTTCRASVASLQRRGPQAYALLEYALRSAQGEPDDVLAWSHGVLAGIAERRGDGAAAADHYRAALALDPDDAFIRAAYADLLLDAGDARQALALTSGRRTHDALLLREALCRARLRDPGTALATRELQARFDAARRRGEATHLREEAQFELQLRGDAQRALDLAKRNWQVQREPADARLLLEAASAAHDRTTQEAARTWLRAVGVVLREPRPGPANTGVRLAERRR